MDAMDNVRTALSVRNFAPRTIVSYCNYLRRTQEYFERPLEELSPEQVAEYFAYLTEVRKLSPRSRNVCHAALTFLYREVLDRPEMMAKVARAKIAHRVPVVLSGTEVAALLASIKSLKHRAILTSCYASGVRVGEACAIRIEDIDSKRMQLRVPISKSLARYTLLSERQLLLLRAYYRHARPTGPHLFAGLGRPHIGPKRPAEVLRKVVRASGIRKQVTPRTLRHCFATHLLDSGVDIRTVQVLLGHRSVVSTGYYTKMSRAMLSCASPYDLLGTPKGDKLG